MAQSLFSCIFVAGIIFPSCIVNAVIEKYQVKRYEGGYVGRDKFISCSCQNRTEITRPIDKEIGQAIVTGSISLDTCYKHQHRDVCDLLFLCSRCLVNSKECFYPEGGSRLQCLKEHYVLKSNYFGGTSSDAASSEKLRRTKRQANVCAYPANLKTADVSCTSSGSAVTCRQTCIFGHTLRDGESVVRTCRKSENRWHPSGFVECDPFVDCTLSLKSPGSLDCYTGTTTTAPLCHVSCLRYEDQPAVPRRAYECLVNGEWNVRLPFCVTPGSGLLLVPRPH